MTRSLNLSQQTLIRQSMEEEDLQITIFPKQKPLSLLGLIFWVIGKEVALIQPMQKPVFQKMEPCRVTFSLSPICLFLVPMQTCASRLNPRSKN